MPYTVKQLAKLAGVTVRTLHYYDEIGLLNPSAHGANGYRYYGHSELLRLQQILFFRELDFSLNEIQALMARADFDLVSALHSHRSALQCRIQRLSQLIATIDQTIDHVKGQKVMSDQDLFTAFDEATQEKYAEEASQRWDPEMVRESNRRWKNYGPAKQKEILNEGKEIYTGLAALIGSDPRSTEVQALIGRWHQNMRHFYEPSPEVLRGLGDLYNDDPAFYANISKIHPQLPAFMREAIRIYVGG